MLDHPKPSPNIMDHLEPSCIISENIEPSWIILDHIWPSPTISDQLGLSLTILDHHEPSGTISDYLWPSSRCCETSSWSWIIRTRKKILLAPFAALVTKLFRDICFVPYGHPTSRSECPSLLTMVPGPCWSLMTPCAYGLRWSMSV